MLNLRKLLAKILDGVKNWISYPKLTIITDGNGTTSHQAAGYLTFPGGLILQGGHKVGTGAQTETVTFNKSFPNKCLFVITSVDGISPTANGYCAYVNTSGGTTTGFTAAIRGFTATTLYNSTGTISYIAIGY